MLQRLSNPWEGIDVSKWQGNIDFKKVKASGKKFVLIRAGYGRLTSQKDPYFEANYKNAKAVGLYVGVYWYSYAESAEDAKLEAKAFLEVIKGKQFDMPVIYDFEESSLFAKGKQFCSDCIKAFCSVMEAAGYWVGLYIFRSALQNYITAEVANRYTMAVSEYAPKLNYAGQYGIWQYSSMGRVNGISGDVDLDKCYYDYPSEIKARGKNGFKAPSGEYRVQATQALDLFKGTDKPPIDGTYKAGDTCTIEKTVQAGTTTWGKIKGRNTWIDLAKTKQV